MERTKEASAREELQAKATALGNGPIADPYPMSPRATAADQIYKDKSAVKVAAAPEKAKAEKEPEKAEKSKPEPEKTSARR